MRKQICMVMPRVENLGDSAILNSWNKTTCPDCGDECYDRQILNYDIKLCSKCYLAVKHKYKLK